jgi:undecaprenyl diphosphate synthase
MTFWAWSTENWKRSEDEVKGIFIIFREVIKRRWKRLGEKGVRIRVIGDISKFPKDIQTSLDKVVEETKNNTKITAIFALNYGGRDEVVRAMNTAISDQLSAIRKGGIHAQAESRDWEMTSDSFSHYLDTTGIPDPELIIRTGGEQRLSGFLLWQSEYSELYFPSFFMPDFTNDKLDEALVEYQNRKRRFGI